MPQIFHRSTNTFSRVSIFGAVFIIAGIVAILMIIVRSPYVTNQSVVRDQPVPFSHKHHVTDDGLDCRYCHTTVETSSFAGMPATQVCMNCHSQIWAQSPALEPVRQSFQTGQPIVWTQVYNLPDYVYFDHSIHVNKGIGCVSCHGRVDQMPLTWQDKSLLMSWCLDCHRDPAKYVRPKEYVFSMDWQPSDMGTDQATLGPQLVQQYHIQSKTSCTTCHR